MVDFTVLVLVSVSDSHQHGQHAMKTVSVPYITVPCDVKGSRASGELISLHFILTSCSVKYLFSVTDHLTSTEWLKFSKLLLSSSFTVSILQLLNLLYSTLVTRDSHLVIFNTPVVQCNHIVQYACHM